MKKTFTAKPYKVGNSHAITIPKKMISNGTIDTTKQYKFRIISETKEEQQA